MSNKIFIGLLLTLLIAISPAATAQTDGINEAIDQGNQLFHRGEYERAIFEYSFTLNWPGMHRAQAHYNIGVCHYRLGRLDQAVAEYRLAVKGRDNQYPSASYALGVALQELRRYREAREAFAQAVKSSGGNHAEALFELGLESQSAGEDKLALDLYRRAIAQSKDRIPACHNNIGVILAGYGRIDEAMAEFETALKRSGSKFAEAVFNLDLCRRRIRSSSQNVIAELKLAGATAGVTMPSE
jgi:tetratricopeptide (TPR) repeat protein